MGYSYQRLCLFSMSAQTHTHSAHSAHTKHTKHTHALHLRHMVVVYISTDISKHVSSSCTLYRSSCTFASVGWWDVLDIYRYAIKRACCTCPAGCKCHRKLLCCALCAACPMSCTVCRV